MKYAGKDGRGGSPAPRNDRFSLGRFVRDVAVGAVMGGLASVAFYGAGKGVEALNKSIRNWRTESRKYLNHVDVYLGDDNFIGLHYQNLKIILLEEMGLDLKREEYLERIIWNIFIRR